MSSRNRPQILIDITRLATRFSRRTPNGIDRVDIAYAHHVLVDDNGRGIFLGPWGARAVDASAARKVVEAIAAHWNERAPASPEALRAVIARIESRKPSPPVMAHGPDGMGDKFKGLRNAVTLFAKSGMLGRNGLWPGRGIAATAPKGSVYINVSQFPVWIDRCFRWLSSRPDMRSLFFLHDILPLTYPEFFPPGEAARHAKRLEVLARRASGLIVSSDHIRDETVRYLREQQFRLPPICVAPLPAADPFNGITQPSPPSCRVPYFVVVGTIEPRKNHLLLLHIWRQLADEMGASAPRLVIAGARGWDCENVADLLERCDKLRHLVVMADNLPTPTLRQLLLGARALLMPTLAEGFGLPVYEALAVGVPVIASAIRPFIGQQFGNHLVTLDPLDGLSWIAQIRLFCLQNESLPVRSHSMQEISGPSWEWHMSHIRDFANSLPAYG